MNVKRYFAPTAREALRALKEALGPDAIVLSNRAVEGGVEILALPGEAVGALQAANRAAVVARAGGEVRPAAVEMPAAAARSADDADFRVSLSALAASAARNASRPVAQPAAEPATVVRAFNPPRIETADYALRSRDGVLRAAAAAQTAARPAPSGPAVFSGRAARSDADEFGSARVRELQETNTRLMAELTGIRGMIERQLAGFAWGETRRQAPARAAMLGELLEAGFSAAIARKLVEAVHEDADRIEAREAVGAALDRLMRACASDEDLLDRGGVYALVGPTGVGKTTTTAKLAARCVVRHGAGRLALITTDGYRIGAQEQLRIYGRILGVPVFSVRDAADLRQTLAGLRNKHMVLIDTMGMSQRDRMVAEQAAMLSGAGDVRRLLLLNATARGDTLDDVVRAYAGGDLAGCIFTKVDEAASLAPALDVAVRHELDIRYLTNGQRVPEDLHLPNRAYLLHRALREHGSASPWHLQGDEAGMLLAAGGA
ncbi:MAG TPA: flagellar biosynthesis protein FlhF [Thauera aminoaromatica]|jgi:flagellar biosynthesis protein FlhF|uniref:Flagellar biosynthesis protein FlhF n=4 Tax=Thauera aminoaromatica TaxID=164330 RepID=C4KAV9_THASP|nr:flagellar biosynthesis protein FlhF [Thauera aminoaromatica]ACR01535.1 GTP-binding signal recognition particle SRP54 G- domain protein [Thauera aminoaromatica]MBL8462554.1 flagellar biosynthesis protein FlhF [Thauera sp.]HNE99614.1 flagellar biosynthesis protein FlhF [Thauera aminoaromatica]